MTKYYFVYVPEKYKKKTVLKLIVTLSSWTSNFDVKVRVDGTRNIYHRAKPCDNLFEDFLLKMTKVFSEKGKRHIRHRIHQLTTFSIFRVAESVFTAKQHLPHECCMYNVLISKNIV